ncbi:MAG: PAS domain-containing sensor histidine kinase [Promethearchaeota archaeon]|nr:MAG: PAS domain-containing sensor histidine kinase [Candidatus Lokiarchaeota archaeon]
MNTVNYNREKVREKYKDLFKYSLDFIYVHDLNGNLLDANEHGLEVLGYEREDIPNVKFLDLLADKSQLKTAYSAIEEIKEGGKQKERSEYKLKTKDGEIVYIQSYGIPLFKNDEMYGILGIATDITAKKKAKLQLKESEKRYKNLFEQNPFAITILNKDGIIVDCNPAAEGLIGYKRENIIGRHFLNISLVQQKDYESVNKLFKKFMNEKEVHRADLQIQRKDETLIWTHVHGSLFRLDNRKYAQIILYDISQRKAAEQLINKELEKLKELDEVRKDLITRISHELKTPLTVINSSIEYLLERNRLNESDLNEETIETIDTLNRGAIRLKRLVENLIDSTKIEYDKFKLIKEKQDFVEIIENVIRELSFLIKKRNLEFKTNFPENFILSVDKMRIKQVLSNLILNAIKNTPPEGLIEVKMEQKGKYLEVSVKDTGIGLTTEEITQIFERFGKIERRGEGFESIETQGSGLGLFISKTIVEMHKGEIWVNSKGRNKGSTFKFTLPIE